MLKTTFISGCRLPCGEDDNIRAGCHRSRGGFERCGPPSTGKDSDAQRVESFDFDETVLAVANDYADVEVDHGKPGSMTVREYRTAFGTAPDDPEWTLEQGTLDLGKPCASTVGICQVSYRITVPKGTEVDPLKTVGNES